MPGTLYVVATPIGNLEDVTLRALRILREVSLIAAEDTRRTARLLQHYSISTQTTSLHEHNEDSKAEGLIARLQAGESIALVSDAGTPVLSDPGARLVAAAHRSGVRVEPIPGPSAITALLSASGFLHPEFLFVGFPPHRSNARKNWIARLAEEPRPMVMFEAPHRIKETLEDLLSGLGDRVLALGREMTKTHEELVVRPISTQLATLREPRGEYTLVVAGSPNSAAAPGPLPTAVELAEEFGQLTDEQGLSRRTALKVLATKHTIPARDVFALLEQAKNSGE